MIDILFLLQGETVPSRYLIPHYLEVCEFVNKELEVPFAGRLARA